MTSENYNFYLFSFDHRGGDTKWQTVLRCSEYIGENHKLIEVLESCVLHIEDLSDMWNDRINVELIRCESSIERERQLHLCTVIIETMMKHSPYNYWSTYAWRCAKTSEVTIYNFPRCLRLNQEKETQYMNRILEWMKK